MEYRNKLKRLKKVLIYTPKNNGVSYHRLIKPYSNQSEFDIEFIKEYNGQECDIFVCNRVFADTIKANESAREELKTKGVKIILDIDDYWNLPETHSHYKMFTQNGLGGVIRDNIRKADLVTTTNPFLASKIISLNSKVEIIENNIDLSEPQWQPRNKEWTNHFGWIASSAHINDIAPFEPITKAIYNGELRRCNLVLGGFTPQSREMKYIAGVMTRGGKIKAEFLPLSEPTHYGGMYHFLDVALAPLQQHDFNRCKSDLKVIEAGAHKKPIIVSDDTAYTTVPQDLIYTAVNARHWVDIIRNIMKDPTEAKEKGERLHKWVKENREINISLRKIEQILLSL